MSSDEVRSTTAAPPPEWDRLELTVRRLLDEYADCGRRLARAEGRIQELEAALEQVSAGGVDPLSLEARIRELEQENRAFRERLDTASAGVRRIYARLQFLEDEA